MSRICSIPLLVFLLSCLGWVQAQEEPYELSYLLVRSSDGRVLHHREPDKLRVPASTLKLVTAVAALESLGGDYRFETTVVASEKPEKSGVTTLVLCGEGDPELTEAALQELADKLAASGIGRASRLAVDPGPYSFPPYGQGWAWDDAGHGYAPEIGGLNTNGGIVELIPDSPPSWLHLSEGSPEGRWLVPGREGVEVRGEVPDSIAAPRPHLRTGEVLSRILVRQKILEPGPIEIAPGQGRILAVHRSRPLRKLLKRALWESDNLAMELFFRASSRSRPEALKGAEVRIVDGSGLSRYNLISARHLVAVLRANTELRELLPGAGEGTLKRRFLDGWAAYQVRAKTGSMSNISSLAGYLFPGTDRECVFAIMINGHLGKRSQRKELENRLLDEWAREVGWPYLTESHPSGQKLTR